MKLAEVQCTPLRFEPGDRILVKVKQPLSRDQVINLRKSIEKWAGPDVEVYIVDVSLMELEIVRRAAEGVETSGGNPGQIISSLS